jgi:hypothetical protein
MILLVLAAALVISVLFRDQIRSFLSAGEKIQIEYTFLVEHVTEEAKNDPKKGEKLRLLERQIPLGEIVNIAESKKEYQSVLDPEEKTSVLTYTCSARVSAQKEERGYEVEGVFIKPGSQFAVETETASFTMVITMVKEPE